MDYEQFILSFTSIIYEALPFIVLGVLIAGLLEEFVPQQAIARIVSNTKVLIGIYLILCSVFFFVGLAAPMVATQVWESGFGDVARQIFWTAALVLVSMLPIALLMELLRRTLFPSFLPES